MKCSKNQMIINE